MDAKKIAAVGYIRMSSEKQEASPEQQREEITKVAKLQKMEIRSRRNGNGYRSHTNGNGAAYLLTGLVYCQQCGAKMHGGCSKRKKNGKEYKYHPYVCSSDTKSGKHNKAGCQHYATKQRVMYDVIVAKLRERLLAGAHMNRLKVAVREHLQNRSKPDAKQTASLNRRLRELDKQLDPFAKKWFDAPESLLKQLTAKAEAKQRERDMIAEQLAQTESATKPIDIESEVENIAEKVWSLAKELEAAELARIGELMKLLVERIEVEFTERYRGKRREYHPTGGRVMFRGESLGFASRGDWI